MDPQTKDELLQDANKKLAELTELERTSSLIKSNVNEFLYKDKTYRIHRPNTKEKDEINKQRITKYSEMLQDSAYLFRKQLIDLLKKKGIDIVKMEDEMKSLHQQEKELLKKLALSTLKDDVDSLKSKIETVRTSIEHLFYEVDERLRYCIEKQLDDVVRFYMLYLVLEVKNGETWEKVYKTYSDYENSDDEILLGRATQILAGLVYNDSF